ncbi:TonB-dependent receptor [Thalassotalea crassostreae]|uniref:TonB-dependent receptor n=1 Tax=Thalassotalea crassostreae TaxID=1763536 RepID=UPI0008389DF4|nr:TonB-dependent receptor [Thalassotalea crassostreae]
MKPSLNKVTKGLLLAYGMGVAAMPAAFAEEALDESKLEVIEVTATKRSTSVQETPMSITAISGDFLKENNITNLQDMSEGVPNFSVGEGISGTKVTMRGMGSGENRSFEQSVGMFIDGVYMPRSRQYVSPFLDPQRVEILRGPQAVMFGLNSTAGSVSVVTAKTNPGDDFHAEVTADYEVEYGEIGTTAVVGGSPTDSLGLRFAYKHQGEGDGYFTNRRNGETLGAVDSDLMRFSAVFQATDNLILTGKVEVADYEKSGSLGETYGPNGLDGDDNKLNYEFWSDPALLDKVFDEEAGMYIDNTNVVLTADYFLGDHTITATLGYSDFEFQFGTDLLNSEGVFLLDGLDTSLFETYEQTSAELRWASPTGETFEWIVGAYYQMSESWQENPGLVPLTAIGQGAFGVPGLIDSNAFVSEDDLISVFVSGTYNMSDDLRIIAGLRYIDQSKDVAGCEYGGYYLADIPEYLPSEQSAGSLCTGAVETYLDGGAVVVATPEFGGTHDVSEVMPELVVQWDLNTDAMLYGKVAQSVKSGGFSTGGDEYDDESVTGFEIGYRSVLADGAAELNATVFYNDFEDLQVGAFIPNEDGTGVDGITNNAGTAVTQGLEIDGRWLATDWLMLNASVAFLDATYDKFTTAGCAAGDDNKEGSIPGTCDLSGENLANAPEITANLGATGTFNITESMNLVTSASVIYSDEYYTDGLNSDIGTQDAYTKINAQIGLESVNNTWAVRVIGRNLTDEAVLTTSQSLMGFGAGHAGYLAAPRTVTVQGTYKF